MISHAATRLQDFAARADAVTPPHRDRTVDALRALAIAGVILGHWMITALVLTHGRTGHVLHDASPLTAMPALTPASWIFQTLAIFFFVGGYAAARSFTGDYRPWLRKRLARLSRPVAVFAAVWAPLAAGLYLGGISGPTLHTLLMLVLDPLWFLGVFAGLTALTPLAVALARRFGARAAWIPLIVVAAVDAVRFAFGGPSPVGWINVAAGWMVPYLLGIAWARGAFQGRKGAALMLAGGVTATAALVLWARYPASMVGVNGAAISNLNPPTLAVVTFGIAQVGLALLMRQRLARWMRRPLAWAAAAAANLSAMTLFLWHQTAFLAVTMAGLIIGRLPGLHTAPSSAAWVAERLAWLPAFAAALAVLWIVFQRAERTQVRHPAPANPERPAQRLNPDHNASRAWPIHQGGRRKEPPFVIRLAGQLPVRYYRGGPPVTTDLESRIRQLESRIRQLEDRTQISEQVIKYAMGVDRRDWAMFAACFTDPVYADFSGSGSPAATVSRADLVARISAALNGFTATQHISPNHVIEFDPSDPDRAICHSYMYAQHLLRGSGSGEFYLLRGSYTNHMLRTPEGWRIERIIQHRSWEYGNTSAVAEAIARSQAQAPAGQANL